MNAYDMFGADKSKESDGIVVDYGSFRIRIRRAGGANVRYEKAFMEKTKTFRRSGIQFESIPLEKQQKILREVYAEEVVLDWDGDGIPFEYSKENALKLFDDLPALFTDIVQQANNSANFKAAEIEAIVKN